MPWWVSAAVGTVVTFACGVHYHFSHKKTWDWLKTGVLWILTAVSVVQLGLAILFPAPTPLSLTVPSADQCHFNPDTLSWVCPPVQYHGLPSGGFWGALWSTPFVQGPILGQLQDFGVEVVGGGLGLVVGFGAARAIGRGRRKVALACPNCGVRNRVLVGTTANCESCHKPLPAPMDVVTCPHCGTRNRIPATAIAANCGSCHKSVRRKPLFDRIDDFLEHPRRDEEDLFR